MSFSISVRYAVSTENTCYLLVAYLPLMIFFLTLTLYFFSCIVIFLILSVLHLKQYIYSQYLSFHFLLNISVFLVYVLD